MSCEDDLAQLQAQSAVLMRQLADVIAVFTYSLGEFNMLTRQLTSYVSPAVKPSPLLWYDILNMLEAGKSVEDIRGFYQQQPPERGGATTANPIAPLQRRAAALGERITRLEGQDEL